MTIILIKSIHCLINFLKVMADSNIFPGCEESIENRSLKNDSDRIEKSAESVESKVYASKRLAPFFQVEVTLKIFGQVIWHWVFPPEK